jgi:hypothetical protein
MEVDEALQVLNIPKSEFRTDKITERYERMFLANDPASGGSFYLQSKVFRAKESLEEELSRITKREK